MLLLWQGLGFNRIVTVLNRHPTIARSTSATCIRIGDSDSLSGHHIGVITGHRRGYSIGYIVLIMSRAILQAGSHQGVVPTNIEKETVTNPTLPYNFSSRPVIYYSILLLTECTSSNLYVIYVSHMPLLIECTPSNRYLIYVSQMLLLAGYTPTNRYVIYISCMLLLAECILAKLLPDSRQPHNVTQSASQPNHCLIHVSHITLLADCVLAKPLPDLCQSFVEYTSSNCCLIYSVISRVCLLNPIHVTCVVVQKVCPANMRIRVGMKEAAKSKQNHLYNRI